eukprot:scaffold116353_cov66-Phaeocystis_antarctica.AAC.6
MELFRDGGLTSSNSGFMLATKGRGACAAAMRLATVSSITCESRGNYPLDATPRKSAAAFAVQAVAFCGQVWGAEAGSSARGQQQLYLHEPPSRSSVKINFPPFKLLSAVLQR